MKIKQLNGSILLVLIVIFNTMIVNAQSKAKSNQRFEPLFNGKNWDGWHLKLRNGDAEMVKKVFAIEDGVVHVFKHMPDSLNLNTGENATHGLFYTNKTYSKYILRFEYKWGRKITNNFDRWQYDAGVYYHVSDDKVWPTGIEYQIRYNHLTNTNHTGDLIRPKGAGYDWFSTKDGKHFLAPNDGGIPKDKSNWIHLATPTKNYNALNDTWNTCEIIVMGGEYTIHKLNGDIVNMAFNLTPEEGIIGFQSETAEIYYRDIEIKEFESSIPNYMVLL
ncbi:DUF1080 domain-containing protein [Formosa sediminum]|uniref:DUF1080 domain-containing protein n=1 Tax=Formosa sediminum TaxID=2594004 RepID=A0A516GRZ4_9FLAO|nr:DUF1080 domain-containing protein [Formosa sediminum]QDO94284.1 DUF1080 domain-containing protein [Formosa sediminum]